MVSKKTRFLQVLCWLVFIGWVVFSFTLSQQDGASSEQVSAGATRWTVRILDLLGIDPDIPHLYMILRKCAHFFVHFMLALLGGFAFETTVRWDFPKEFIASFYLTTAIAVVDELIQLLACERVFSMRDIIINESGVALGTFFSIVICLICESLSTPKPT